MAKVQSLFGHEDFGFSLAWHPSGTMLATGNQDQTCKVWDMRAPSYCLKTLNCLMGAAAHIKFPSDDRLVFSETVDHVQIFDTKTFTQHQDIDVFGEITGFDTWEDRLFIGVKEEPNLSCIMEYFADTKPRDDLS